MHSKCSVSAAAAAKSLESCPTLCDLIDGSPPGSPVPGILQARTLEWTYRGLKFYLDSSYTGCFSYSWRTFSQNLPPAVRPAAKPAKQLIFLPSAFPQLPLQLQSHWHYVTFIFFFFSPFELSSTSTLVSRANQPNIDAMGHGTLAFLKLILTFDSHVLKEARLPTIFSTTVTGDIRCLQIMYLYFNWTLQYFDSSPNDKSWGR